MKPQFGSPQHQWPREIRREGGVVRHTKSALQISRRVLPPRLSPQELREYDLQGTRLQPLALGIVTSSAPSRSPESPLFRSRSTRCLQLCHLKRCAPNRGKRLRRPAKVQNSDALTVQSNPLPSIPLQQDYAQSVRATRYAIVPRLIRSYHLAPLLARWLPPSSLGKRRTLRDATRTWPHGTDKG